MKQPSKNHSKINPQYLMAAYVESSVNAAIFSTIIIIIAKLQGLYLPIFLLALTSGFKNVVGLFYAFFSKITLKQSIKINIWMNIFYFISLLILLIEINVFTLTILSCIQSVSTALYKFKGMNDIELFKGSKRINSTMQSLNNLGILLGVILVAVASHFVNEIQILWFLTLTIILSTIIFIWSFIIVKRNNIG